MSVGQREVIKTNQMKTIDKEIIGFIEKYPFFTDPIVLFNPEKIPTKEEILF